jgi:hypothetical protein
MRLAPVSDADLQEGWVEQRKEREADVALLLEAAIFSIPGPRYPAPAALPCEVLAHDEEGKSSGCSGWWHKTQGDARKSSSSSSYVCAWLVVTSMRRWGLLDLPDTPGTPAPLPSRPHASPPAWGPKGEPYFMYERLVGACASMAAAVDPAAPQALVLLSSLIVLHGMLQQEGGAAGTAHPHDVRARCAANAEAASQSAKTADAASGKLLEARLEARRASTAAPSSSSAWSGSCGGPSLVERRREAGRRVREEACVLLRRLAVLECSRMEAAAHRVAVACSAAQLSGTWHDLGSEVQAPAKDALHALAARFGQHSMLACLRRCVAEAAMRALDAALLDCILRHGLACTFDAALHVKETAAGLERCAHTLAPHLGFASPSPEHEPAPAAAAISQIPTAPPQAVSGSGHGGAPRAQLSLPLTRQVPAPSSLQSSLVFVASLPLPKSYTSYSLWAIKWVVLAGGCGPLAGPSATRGGDGVKRMCRRRAEQASSKQRPARLPAAANRPKRCCRPATANSPKRCCRPATANKQRPGLQQPTAPSARYSRLELAACGCSRVWLVGALGDRRPCPWLVAQQARQVDCGHVRRLSRASRRDRGRLVPRWSASPLRTPPLLDASIKA